MTQRPSKKTKFRPSSLSKMMRLNTESNPPTTITTATELTTTFPAPTPPNSAVPHEAQKQPSPLTPSIPLPSPPLTWKWKCHNCKSRFPLACTRRCLECSHTFCTRLPDDDENNNNVRKKGRRGRNKPSPCKSSFDYMGWAPWQVLRRMEAAKARASLEGNGVTKDFDEVLAAKRGYVSWYRVVDDDTDDNNQTGRSEEEKENLFPRAELIQYRRSGGMLWRSFAVEDCRDVEIRKEKALSGRGAHNCWIDCDFPAECINSRFRAALEGRFYERSSVGRKAAREVRRERLLRWPQGMAVSGGGKVREATATTVTATATKREEANVAAVVVEEKEEDQDLIIFPAENQKQRRRNSQSGTTNTSTPTPTATTVTAIDPRLLLLSVKEDTTTTIIWTKTRSSTSKISPTKTSTAREQKPKTQNQDPTTAELLLNSYIHHHHHQQHHQNPNPTFHSNTNSNINSNSHPHSHPHPHPQHPEQKQQQQQPPTLIPTSTWEEYLNTKDHSKDGDGILTMPIDDAETSDAEAYAEADAYFDIYNNDSSSITKSSSSSLSSLSYFDTSSSSSSSFSSASSFSSSSSSSSSSSEEEDDEYDYDYDHEDGEESMDYITEEEDDRDVEMSD